MAYQGPQRRLISNDQVAMVPRREIPRSRFTHRRQVNTAFNAAQLIPFVVEEVLPADQWSFDVSAFVRMATPLFPMFDNQTVHTFFFFVPNRIVWTNWAQFMGEAPISGIASAPSMPLVTSAGAGFLQRGLGDYFGLPVTNTQVTGTLAVQALPWRAYYAIWNAWFRDQNTQNALPYAVDDSNAVETAFGVTLRNKYHDYFTSVLPWPFKGNQAGGVPLSGSLPVQGIGFGAGGVTGPTGTLRETGGVNTTYTWYSIETQQPTYFRFSGSTSGYPQIFADLSSSGSMRIDDFRRAISIQTMYERDARGGTRYVEMIFEHFGVRNPDYRLQRPEYIGGGSSPMTITPVAQTAPVAGGGTVGALGAAGTGMGMHKASYAATEHGWIIGLINVQSQLSYQQGIHKKWSRVNRTDYYFPALSDLGEQAVLRQEIYATGNLGSDQTVFGYQERWAEYRYAQSMVTGVFRSAISGTLDAWHLSQYFLSAPVLSDTFLRDDPPMARVLAAGATASGQQFLANIEIAASVTRAMPTHSVPAALGRF